MDYVGLAGSATGAVADELLQWISDWYFGAYCQHHNWIKVYVRHSRRTTPCEMEQSHDKTNKNEKTQQLIMNEKLWVPSNLFHRDFTCSASALQICEAFTPISHKSNFLCSTFMEKLIKSKFMNSRMRTVLSQMFLVPYYFFFDLMYWLKILITANEFICIDIERLFAFFLFIRSP